VGEEEFPTKEKVSSRKSQKKGEITEKRRHLLSSVSAMGRDTEHVRATRDSELWREEGNRHREYRKNYVTERGPRNRKEEGQINLYTTVIKIGIVDARKKLEIPLSKKKSKKNTLGRGNELVETKVKSKGSPESKRSHALTMNKGELGEKALEKRLRGRGERGRERISSSIQRKTHQTLRPNFGLRNDEFARWLNFRGVKGERVREERKRHRAEKIPR